MDPKKSIKNILIQRYVKRTESYLFNEKVLDYTMNKIDSFYRPIKEDEIKKIITSLNKDIELRKFQDFIEANIYYSKDIQELENDEKILYFQFMQDSDLPTICQFQNRLVDGLTKVSKEYGLDIAIKEETERILIPSLIEDKEEFYRIHNNFKSEYMNCKSELEYQKLVIDPIIEKVFEAKKYMIKELAETIKWTKKSLRRNVNQN